MEYRRLGHSGIRVAPLAIGTMNFGRPTTRDEACAIIDVMLDSGLNLLDTADMYNAGESERIIGAALAQSGRRHEVVLATKAYYPTGPGPNDRGNSRLHLMRAVDASLARLQTDYLDLFQLHRPDPDVPIEETLSALTDLVRAGKVRSIGCSTHPAWQVMEALAVSRQYGFARFVSEQPPYNLLDRRIENELVPLAQRHDLALLPWSPLAQGLLAGRYRQAAAPPPDSRAADRGGIYAERVTERGIAVGTAFGELAAQHGHDAAQLAMRWVIDQPGITAPLFGPRSVEQLRAMLPVLDLRLSETLRQACDELVAPGSMAVNFHNTAAWMKMR